MLLRALVVPARLGEPARAFSRCWPEAGLPCRRPEGWGAPALDRLGNDRDGVALGSPEISMYRSRAFDLRGLVAVDRDRLVAVGGETGGDAFGGLLLTLAACPY